MHRQGNYIARVASWLEKMQYEMYLQKKDKIVNMLHDFRVHEKITLNEDSTVLHVG
jgi:hypothetical protein